MWAEALLEKWMRVVMNEGGVAALEVASTAAVERVARKAGWRNAREREQAEILEWHAGEGRM